jgi:hypothetical protein
MDLIRHPIVFLHLPRTRGTPIHAALARQIGAPRVANGVHAPGHVLYSGQLDWDGFEALPQGRFAFTVLRDPRERIAALYFHLRATAAALPPDQPCDADHRNALEWTADDFFFGGDAAWQARIAENFDNLYCSYFGSRLVRGAAAFRALPRAEALGIARHSLAQLDGVFHSTDLRPLEAALQERYGFVLRLGERGEPVDDEPKWPRLLEALDTDAARARIEALAERDAELMVRRNGGH